jgi:outer membrane lipoprotein-sorting protein
VVGTIPTQVDYGDYREVAGVKMPFNWTVTWTGGQSIINLKEVQANVQIDPARFAKPAPAVVTKPVVK